ncbi:MAG: Lipoprotein signal peptidase [Clostridia bacterium 41_269]|nr:MAG: Lipoprotein signal peptidase [Clostridia bacterium 41_269]
MHFFTWAAVVLILDQLSKHLIQRIIAEGESIPILPGVFHLTLYKNPGAAFGIFAYKTNLFITVTIIVMIIIIFFYLKLPKSMGLAKISLALQFGGAAGNFIDRILHGYVVDFIDFRVWPVFNIADSAIVIGVILLCWDFFIQREKEGCDEGDKNGCVGK